MRVELHADGTFTAQNVPPLKLEEPDPNYAKTLISGNGKWEKDKQGIIDPGGKTIWGVYLRTKTDELSPAQITGQQAPYGLIFTIGDPDSGNALLLSRKATE